MLPDIANLCLYVALSLCIFISISPILERTGITIKYTCYKNCWIAVFFFILIAFLILIYSYIISDFSILNVVQHSHTNKPLIYKISGAWGNHEGSMLLWITAINVFTVIFCLINHNETVGKLTLSIQAFFNIFFIAFTIFVSSPFTRIFPAPTNGFGLNPILQDIGLAMHPPILYLGYVGFSTSYSITIAALITNKINKFWADIVRICSLISWCFLTAGIALGSWWAYRELGWGGFWFWDPVENASLMPWLSATALIHAINVYRKTGHLREWSIILATTTFILSMLGMFLVRSGIVTSVHAFAVDSSRGIYILSFFSLILLASLILYLSKINLQQKVLVKILSIPFFISINNLILTVAIATIIIGTVYPMILEILTDTKISVGPSYFNTVFNPMIIILAGFCALTTGLLWKKNIKNQAILLVIAIIIAVIIVIKFALKYQILAILGIFLGLWLIIATIFLLFNRDRNHNLNFYSMILGHLGFAIILIAIAINSTLSKEAHVKLKIGDDIEFAGYKISLINVFYEKKPSYLTQIAVINIKDGNTKITLTPELRFFEIEQQQKIKSDIYKTIFVDLYIAVDKIYSDSGLTMLIYYKPMMVWLWFGTLLIVIACARSAIIAIINYLNSYQII